MKKYEILGKLGQGGMGVVYKALQRNLDREVAIKVLPKTYSQNAEVRKRFEAEIRVCAGLNHPNIIQIIDRGEQDDTFYYVMEYVKGRSLLEVLNDGPLPLERALSITEDILEAFRYIHPRGIVHRDIKPANIMVDEHDKAVVMDFGLVKVLYASGITMQGRLVGTPRYMSPEMLRGSQLDARSDIFQLGLVLYEMVTATHAFRGRDRAEVTRKLLEQEPERASAINPSLPASVEVLIANAIEKDPDLRYGDAEQMLADVHRVREGERLELRRTQIAPEEGASTNAAVAARRRAHTTRTLNAGEGVETPAAKLAAGHSGILGFLAGLVALGALMGYLIFPGRPVVYSAQNMRVEAAFESARVYWTSEQPYPSLVEFGHVGGALELRRPEGEQAPGREHEVLLEDLNEGEEYRYRLRYPGEQSSPFYTFRTRVLQISDLTVQRRGIRELLVELTTSEECMVDLEMRGDDGSVQTQVVSSEPTREHRAVLPSLGPSASLSYRVAVRARTGTTKHSSWVVLPSVLDLSRTLSRALENLPHQDWIATVEAGNPEDRSEILNRIVLPQWRRHPARDLLEEMRPVAPEYFLSPDISPALKLGLHHGLGRLEDLETYGRGRQLLLNLGVRGLRGPSFSLSRSPRLSGKPVASGIVPKPTFFNPLSPSVRGNPKLQGGLLVMLDGRNSYSFPVNLPELGGAREAELGLDLSFGSPFNVFRVKINGKLTLSFYNMRGARPEMRGYLYHTFDAGVLRKGPNFFVVKVEPLGEGINEAGRMRAWKLFTSNPSPGG